MGRSDRRAVKIFKALANIHRLKLVKSLLEGSKNVSRLADELGVVSETVSKHLRVLRNCELVTNEPKGNRVIYSVKRPEVVEKLLAILPDLHREQDPDSSS